MEILALTFVLHNAPASRMLLSVPASFEPPLPAPPPDPPVPPVPPVLLPEPPFPPPVVEVPPEPALPVVVLPVEVPPLPVGVPVVLDDVPPLPRPPSLGSSSSGNVQSNPRTPRPPNTLTERKCLRDIK